MACGGHRTPNGGWGCVRALTQAILSPEKIVLPLIWRRMGQFAVVAPRYIYGASGRAGWPLTNSGCGCGGSGTRDCHVNHRDSLFYQALPWLAVHIICCGVVVRPFCLLLMQTANASHQRKVCTSAMEDVFTIQIRPLSLWPTCRHSGSHQCLLLNCHGFVQTVSGLRGDVGPHGVRTGAYRRRFTAESLAPSHRAPMRPPFW